MQSTYSPLRTLRDVEELERVPLEQRVFSWNLNDWIARGCALDPDKIAIQYVADGNPDRQPVAVTYRELRTRSNQAANLFHSLGVSGGDAVLFLLPNVPELFVVMLGSLAAGIACSVNWMLKPEQLGELDSLDQGQGDRRARPHPGLRDLGERAGDPRRHPRIGAHSLRARSGRSGPARERPRHARLPPAGRQARIRAQGRARRHCRLYPFRRHHRLAQAGQAHAPRLRLQVLGQCGGDGAYRRRRDLRRISDVPYRRHFRQGLVRDRARHVDRNPLPARRPRQAVHRQLLEVRRALRRHDLLRRADDPGATGEEQAAGRKARLAARVRLHRLDRVPGRGCAPDRGDDRRARAAHLWRHRIHPERQPGAARRRSEIRLARHPPALHADQDGRARR